MKPSIPLLIVAAILSIASCDRSAEPPTDVDTSSIREARTAAKAIPYKAEIETGLKKQFNYLKIPCGEILIMSGLDSQMESPNLKEKKFHINMLKALDKWKGAGLVTYAEKEQSDLAMIGNMGTRFFTVTPLQKAIEASDPKESSPEILYIPLGECKVISVVKDMKYSNPNLPQSDDFRLVVGTYSRSYSKFLTELEGHKDAEIFKFRALLKLNPFNQTYSFQFADWGNPDDDTWKTQNIPN